MTARYTAFEDNTLLAAGSRQTIVRKINARMRAGSQGTILVFEDGSGKQIDLDLRASEAGEKPEAPSPGKGRPRLGVVAREVTLLPRHWEWLKAQPGGASAALRLLVDEARRSEAGVNASRHSQNAAYNFMSAIAGNLPGYEEAIRALFAIDQAGFEAETAGWPADIRSHAQQLAAAAFASGARCLDGTVTPERS
ncbi:MAG: DUF2239 family protein [Halieaceae bacterium]|nr:DUF2239 family protein [Halieaceae bacterium]